MHSRIDQSNIGGPFEASGGRT